MQENSTLFLLHISSVVDPDPVGSETFCRSRKKSFKMRAARRSTSICLCRRFKTRDEEPLSSNCMGFTCLLHGRNGLSSRLRTAGRGGRMRGREQGRGRARLRLEGGERLARRRHLLVEAGDDAAGRVVLVQRVRQLLPAHTNTWVMNLMNTMLKGTVSRDRFGF
jgi:hypothetical protein